MERFEFKNYVDGKELDLLNDFPVVCLAEEVADHIVYTLRHKKAIIMTYMELTGLVTSFSSRLWLHDLEKVWLYYNLQDVKKSHELHVKNASHHYPNWSSDEDRKEAVLDYECARITKPDKPRNALETIRYFRPQTEVLLVDILDAWNINSTERKDFEFTLYQQNKDYVENTLYQAMKGWMETMPQNVDKTTFDFDKMAKEFSEKSGILLI